MGIQIASNPTSIDYHNYLPLSLSLSFLFYFDFLDINDIYINLTITG